jgi:hypothetical protein
VEHGEEEDRCEEATDDGRDKGKWKKGIRYNLYQYSITIISV